MGFAIFQYSLENSAAIRMNGKNIDLTSEGFYDKLEVLGRDTLDGSLDNMVAILIFHALENISLEFFDELRLLIGENMFESLE